MKGGVVLFFCGGAHPSPPKGREPDTHPHPLPKGGGQGTSTYTFRRICYPPEQKGAMYQGRAIPLPKGGGRVLLSFCQMLRAGGGFNPPALRYRKERIRLLICKLPMNEWLIYI